MTVITSIASKARRAAPATQETNEFEGIWLNPCIIVGEGDDRKALRFNSKGRSGVALSDLSMRKLYDSMDPQYAAEQQIMNDRLEALQERSKTLEEGEWIVVNIPVVMYRRQEEAVVPPVATADKMAIHDELFGD